MNERELLVDCLRRLNATDITYYLTGSMASNYWGIPRTTCDLDFVVQLPPSAVPRILGKCFGGASKSPDCHGRRRHPTHTPLESHFPV